MHQHLDALRSRRDRSVSMSRAMQAGGDHSPADGFAMQEVLVVGLRLQRMADGVAEVQDAPLAILALVAR